MLVPVSNYTVRYFPKERKWEENSSAARGRDPQTMQISPKARKYQQLCAYKTFTLKNAYFYTNNIFLNDPISLQAL